MIDESLRHAVLSRITPTDAEVRHQQRVIARIIEALQSRAEEIGQTYVKIEPQGSTGIKQTQLRGDADIDLFVGLSSHVLEDIIGLDTGTRKKALWQILNSLVDTWFIPAMQRIKAKQIKKTYTDHPYLSCVVDGVDIDLVSYIHMSAEQLQAHGPITAVDRTVHHSKYVVDHLTEQKRENVRILKSFVKACYAYGDTCAIGRNGLTGYALEIIVIRSHDLEHAFRNLFTLHQTPHDPLERPLSKLQAIPTFRNDFAFVIDPTDTNRNVAASLDARSFRWTALKIEELSHAIKAHDEEHAMNLLLERPIPTDPPPPELAPHLMAFEFVSDGSYHYTVIRDKLYHVGHRLVKEMERESTGEVRFGKVLFELYFEGNVFALGVYVSHPTISPDYERRGPALKHIDAVARFKLRNPHHFERDGHVWTVKRRKWTTALEMAMHLLNKVSIKGVHRTTESGQVSKRILNVMAYCIVPLEILHR